LNTFITILIKSLRIPCGMVHGIHMDCSMWTGAWIGAWIPYGIVHGFAIKIHWKFHGIHMESNGLVHGIHMEWCIPWTIHMDSIVGMD